VRNRTPADLVNSEVPSHRAPPENVRGYMPARRTSTETARTDGARHASFAMSKSCTARSPS